MEKDGSEYCAQVDEVLLEERVVSISMELSGCYPEGTVKSYRRKVEFKKDEFLCVTDTFSPYREGTFLSLMTAEIPSWQNNILQIGQLEKLYFEGNVHAEIEEIKLKDAKLKKEWGNSLYRTKIYPNSPKIIFTVKF